MLDDRDWMLDGSKKGIFSALALPLRAGYQARDPRLGQDSI